MIVLHDTQFLASNNDTLSEGSLYNYCPCDRGGTTVFFVPLSSSFGIRNTAIRYSAACGFAFY